MSHEHPRRRSLDSLRKEAKAWLRAIRAQQADARARFEKALPHAPHAPALRDVQHALAREHGFAGWAALTQALASQRDGSGTALAEFQAMADALLDAYRTGTPAAMERHYRYTWHRRPWRGMRTYVQLDLGKRPAGPDDDVDITLEEARHLVAIEHGFPSWAALTASTQSLQLESQMAAKPIRLVERDSDDDVHPIASSREWTAIVRLLAAHPSARLDAEGEMTDAVLADVCGVEGVTDLNLAGSKRLTDEGVRHLARLPGLKHLDLSGTAVTDRGLEVLRELPTLESVSLAMTRVTDRGVAHLAPCQELRRVNLAWTHTGDAALKALAGKPKLHELASGNELSDAGIAVLHELPVFKSWHGGETRLGLLSYRALPNQLLLRGSFTDRGMQHIHGLDGLFGLNLDDRNLAIGAAALEPLISLPHLGWLAVDARDDWMPLIARMPRLRFLGRRTPSPATKGSPRSARHRRSSTSGVGAATIFVATVSWHSPGCHHCAASR